MASNYPPRPRKAGVDSDKSRQRKASKAAGQIKLSYHGKDKSGEKWYSVGSRSAKKVAGWPTDSTRDGEKFAGRTYASKSLLKNQAERIKRNIPKSKSAQARFLASEKKRKAR